jgi:hypothetical protein
MVQRCQGGGANSLHARCASISDMPEIIGFKLKLIITHAL